MTADKIIRRAVHVVVFVILIENVWKWIGG